MAASPTGTTADQLRLARRRDGAPLLQADGTALPFADGVFGTVTTLGISTDTGDFAGLLRGRQGAEARRPAAVLGRPPVLQRPAHREPRRRSLIIHPTSRTRGWHPRSAWWPKGGVRDRVGMSQIPLPDLINAFIDAGLTIKRVYEPYEQPIPNILAVRAVRHQAS